MHLPTPTPTPTPTPAPTPLPLPLPLTLKKKGMWCICSSPREAQAESIRLTRSRLLGGGSEGSRLLVENICTGRSSVGE